MKLNTPRTIQTSINEERRADIDNGLVLARKLDKLREELQVLERQRALFVAANTTHLQDKVEELNQEVEGKESHISDLEAKRQTLLEPFTLEVDSKREELKLKEESLIQFRNDLTQKEIFLSEREINVSRDEERVEEEKKELNVQVNKVVDSSLEAQKVLLEAIEYEKATTLALTEKNSTLVKKEVGLSLREKKLISEEKQNEKEKKEIINEKIRLADQRGTLERAMSRLK